MAARSNTAPILLVALALAGALVWFASGALEVDPPGWETAVELSELDPAAPEPVAPTQPAATALGDTQGMTLAAPKVSSAELEVVVLDGNGRKLEAFKVQLNGPNGERLVLTEQGLLSDLAPGPWALLATHLTLLPAHASIELSNGRRRRVVLQLLDHIRITGRVVDDHGEPEVRLAVWLLGPSESHPPSESIALARTSATTAAKGEFHMRVPGPGTYRFSVGPPGVPRWQQRDTVEITTTGPEHADLVVPSEGRFLVRMAEEPGRDRSSKLTLEIEALRQTGPGPAQGGRGGRNRRGGGENNRRGQGAESQPLRTPPNSEGEDTGDGSDSKKRERASGRNRRKNRNGEAPQEQAEEAQTTPVPSGSRGTFVRWQSEGIDTRTETMIEHAPLDRELRLVLILKGKRYTSADTIRLVPGVTNRATLSWPQPGQPGEPLRFLFERVQPPADQPPVGCTWTDV